MSQSPTGDRPRKEEFRPGPLGAAAKNRNAIGVSLGAIAAWYPVVQGLDVYHQVMKSNECGFLCMFLWPAFGWWIGAFFLAFIFWLVTAVVLHRLGST